MTIRDRATFAKAHRFDARGGDAALSQIPLGARCSPLAKRDVVLDGSTLIGVAGTVTTVAAIEIGLAEYDPEVLHHFRLTREAAEDVFRTLATEPAVDRRHNPGLEAARVDVIVGGAAVLVAVMRHWAFEEMIVSEADILDGLVRSQLPG